MNFFEKLLRKSSMHKLFRSLNETHIDEWDLRLPQYIGVEWQIIKNRFPEMIIAPPMFPESELEYLELEAEFGFLAFVFENKICIDAGVFYNKKSEGSLLFWQYLKSKHEPL